MVCVLEDEHAHKILIKTVYRRAKAFCAKREVICGLNDAAMQLRQTTPAKLDSDYYIVFREVRTVHQTVVFDVSVYVLKLYVMWCATWWVANARQWRITPHFGQWPTKDVRSRAV